MIRTLTFSTLFPNAMQPSHGVFVENRLRKLLATGKVSTRVVAPVPWFPIASPRFGEYGRFAAVPAHETRGDIEIDHPRYLVLPRIGMRLSPWTLFWSARRAVAALRGRGFEFDLIDAHYFYPDGVAAVWLGRELGKPVVITGRGTDLNLIPRYPMPRRLIAEAAQGAAGLITVCAALRDPLVELGVAPEKVNVLRNGVDLDVFRPLDRGVERARLGLTRPTLLSIGHLIERKGHDLVIGALARLPDAELLIAGDGPEDANLKALAERLGVTARVRFLGRKPHAELAGLYSAVDATVLASSREGWANVLLESMACGTPVVASAIWGTPEVVAAPVAGRLVRERTAEGFATEIAALLADPPDRAATRRYAEGFSWDDTTAGQLRLFESIIARRPGAAGGV